METPIFTRSLTEAERSTLHSRLRYSNAFTLHRRQILLASAEGKTPRQIARRVGCTDQAVRNVIRSFERERLECLTPKSSAPTSKHRNSTRRSESNGAGDPRRDRRW